MNIYKARYKNALRQAAKVNRLLKKGYIVFDENNEKVLPFKFDSKERIIYQENNIPGHRFRYRLFQDDKEWDHGLYTTITEFNKKFEKWYIIHPNNIQPFN